MGFDRANVVDISGPMEAFSLAGDLLAAEGASAPGYAPLLAAADTGPIATSCGLELVARSLSQVRGPVDTLLVAGGSGTEAALLDSALMAGVERLARRARRVASVCSGTFVLAELGLLDGRRAVTHWARCESLAHRYPAVAVEPDAIFVRDGNVYSSAGVTAGIDLALALVEEDCGRELALAVARWMVVFLKRPGGQSQFSAQLAGQLAEQDGLRALQSWILEHPAGDCSVQALAKRAGMSPRNFARVFAREVGMTPARFVEAARVDEARRLLEESARSVEEVGAAAGFGSSEAMRRAFHRRLGIGPADYRRRFRPTTATHA